LQIKGEGPRAFAKTSHFRFSEQLIRTWLGQQDFNLPARARKRMRVVLSFWLLMTALKSIVVPWSMVNKMSNVDRPLPLMYMSSHQLPPTPDPPLPLL